MPRPFSLGVQAMAASFRTVLTRTWNVVSMAEAGRALQLASPAGNCPGQCQRQLPRLTESLATSVLTESLASKQVGQL